LTEHAGVV